MYGMALFSKYLHTHRKESAQNPSSSLNISMNTIDSLESQLYTYIFFFSQNYGILNCIKGFHSYFLKVLFRNHNIYTLYMMKYMVPLVNFNDTL